MASGRANIPRPRRRLFWKMVLVLCVMVIVAWPFGWLVSFSATAVCGGHEFALNEGRGLVELRYHRMATFPSMGWTTFVLVGAGETDGIRPHWEWGWEPNWNLGIARWSDAFRQDRTVSLALSGWFVMLLTSAFGFVAWRGVRKHRPTPFNACAACGYSMRGLSTDAKCPECGSSSKG